MGTHKSRPIVLLGPQRFAPTVRDALEPLVKKAGAVAAVTAGWEEREAEDLELGEHLDREVHNLQLHRRAEQVFRKDAELFQALQELHDELHELQRIYRLRLRYLVPAAEELLRRAGSAKLLDPEREAAFESLRALDRHHLERVEEIQADFTHRWSPSEREAVAQQRHELQTLLKDSRALCIAGGHVGILMNRLWLFDVDGLLPKTTPIVAWSAGAMALAEQVVLFHDSPPQGRGYAEVLRPGIGLCPGIVPLPHASRRLRLEDHVRVQILARRFPDAICAALDENTQLTWDGRVWTATRMTMQLAQSGELVEVGS